MKILLFWKMFYIQHIISFFFLFAFSLIYTPCQDCSGVEYINITMYEEQRDPDIPSANATDMITVNIEPVNDPPLIFLFHNGQSILHDDPTEPITVCLTAWQYHSGLFDILYREYWSIIGFFGDFSANYIRYLALSYVFIDRSGIGLC